MGAPNGLDTTAEDPDRRQLQRCRYDIVHKVHLRSIRLSVEPCAIATARDILLPKLMSGNVRVIVANALAA